MGVQEGQKDDKKEARDTQKRAVGSEKEKTKERRRNSRTLVKFCFSSRRRHTRYWRDWSSDVCSSDLVHPRTRHRGGGRRADGGVRRHARPADGAGLRRRAGGALRAPRATVARGVGARRGHQDR